MKSVSSRDFGEVLQSRKRPRVEDGRGPYYRDTTAIIHSSPFRRLKHKTQVFFAPSNDHICTRMEHVLHVASIASAICRQLGLDSEMAWAIGMGHDLGHTPFGHVGERIISKLSEERGLGRFEHEVNSLRVVDFLSNGGRGLNLTWETRDGILNHQTSGHPATLEGQVVRLSDKIAYLNHDVDDAIRGGLITEEDIPKEYTEVLGHNVHDRLNSLIHDVITHSFGRKTIVMSPDYENAMQGLRKWMFGNIYTGGRAKAEEHKAQQMIELLFDHYMKHPEELTTEYRMLIERGDSRERAVCDYISGMTDNYAIEKFEELFVPLGWRVS